ILNTLKLPISPSANFANQKTTQLVQRSFNHSVIHEGYVVSPKIWLSRSLRSSSMSARRDALTLENLGLRKVVTFTGKQATNRHTRRRPSTMKPVFGNRLKKFGSNNKLMQLPGSGLKHSRKLLAILTNRLQRPWVKRPSPASRKV